MTLQRDGESMGDEVESQLVWQHMVMCSSVSEREGGREAGSTNGPAFSFMSVMQQ